MMTDDEIIAVVQAHKEGKQIHFRSNTPPPPRCGELGWNIYQGEPWNFQLFDYRVAPEQRRPREWAVYVTNDGRIMQDCKTVTEHLEYPYIRVREVIE